MKKMNRKNKLLLLAGCFACFTTLAQITPAQLKQFISDHKQAAAINEFYKLTDYQTTWIQNENTGNRDIFLYILKLSPVMALRENDYQPDLIRAFRNGNIRLINTDDSLEAELRFTDAALHFYSDLAYGNTKPSLDYNGLKYVSDCRNIPSLLADHILKKSLPLLPTHLSPALPEITAIENKIKSFLIVLSDSNFREVIITSKNVTISNTPLVSKLYQLGIIKSLNDKLPDSLLKQKVIESQRLFNLLPDGVLRSTAQQELNVPLTVRLQQLNLSVNYYRWLYCLVQNQSVIVVNIPAAYMKVYRYRDVVLEMSMIVGKKSTPTPTLASTVSEVILYPYWHVPYSIATKEILPAVKRNPGYIDAGNYQVLNRAGKIIDPYSVNWRAFSAGYFPFIIRQSTGCDNALGLIKLNFYSPFGVYLHDTPNKYLFMLNRRFFSHGCMRMEKPMDLGHLVLKNNAIAIDTLEQKGCLRNQSPITVNANDHMPVIVWYNPAGIDLNGHLLFYEDVYGKFDWMKKLK